MNITLHERPEISLVPFVQYQPNSEAQEVKRRLDTPFNPYPAKAALDKRNKLILWLASPFLRERLNLSPKTILGTLPYVGTYIGEIHSFFYVPAPFEHLSSKTVFLHENVHGLVASLNPSLQIRSMRRRQLAAEIKAKPRKERRDLEVLLGLSNEAQANRYLGEGLAEWGAHETLARSWGFTNPTVLNSNHCQEIIKTLEVLKDAVADPELNYYARGHYFVYKVISVLEVAGMDRLDAFKLLVANPPKTLEELKDAAKFAHQIS